MFRVDPRVFGAVAFSVVCMGVTAQAFHVYMLAGFMSNFTGWAKALQSCFLAVFFSLGLLYFTVKSGAVGGGVKYARVATSLAVFEGFLNAYYWCYKLVLFPALGVDFFSPDWSACDWYSVPAAVAFSVAIPALVRCYAGEVPVELSGGERAGRRVVLPARVEASLGAKGVKDTV
jgi:hypothetical protein